MEVCILDLATLVETQLTRNREPDMNAAWSPDGQRLAFVGLRDGNYDIYVTADLGEGAGDEAQRVTQGGAAEWSPAWSPDGERIAFSSGSGQGNDRDVYALRLADGRVSLLVHTDLQDYGPAWSPDGRSLAFVSGTDEGTELYLATGLDPEGGDDAEGLLVRGVEQLTQDPQGRIAYAPVWAPDGSRIAYTRYRDPSTQIGYVYELSSGESTRVEFPSNQFKVFAWTAARVAGK